MPESGFWYIELASGKNYVVHIKMVDPDMLHFDESAWIADSGVQLSAFLANGPSAPSEIEVMGPGKFPRSLIAGIWQWGHKMPVTQ